MSFAARLQDVEPEIFIGFVFFELVRGFQDLVFEIVVVDCRAECAENGGEILALLDIDPVPVVGVVPRVNFCYRINSPGEAGSLARLSKKAGQIALVTGANDMHFRPVLIEVGSFFDDRKEADI